MDILILGDTVRSPELRHEIPLGIPDAFLYLERDGRRGLMISSLETPRVEQLGGLEIMSPEELGIDELFAQGMERDRIGLELSLRACKRFGVTSAAVPHTFPLEYADYLRDGGVELKADRKVFEGRRRVKNDAELEGIRRAQRAAEAGMEAARDLLRRAQASNGNGALTVDGEPLTSERIKRAIDEAFIAHDCGADEFIVSHGPQSAIGHDMGSGQIAAGEPIVIDLWPRDRESACFADMTRTYVVGEPSDELKEWQRLVKEALDRALDGIRPGVTGFDLFKETCDLFQEHGYPTQLSKEPGTVLADGFFHGLGHGVGLEVHEEPGMGLGAKKKLVAGDVVTIEPGLYRSGYGGCRLEDLVLVTADGAENLTKFPYDLAP